MEELKAKWDAMSLPMKVLTIIGLPLVLILVVLRAGGTIAGIANTKARNETDEQEKKLRSDKTELDIQTAKVEGHLEATQEAKAEALKDAKNEDPSDFFNHRFDDSK